MDIKHIIKSSLEESALVNAQTSVDKDMIFALSKASNLLIETFLSKGKILLAGNGGSAADSQHLAAEFVGRFVKERKSLPAIALTTDSSIVTAIGNDYGFDKIFERQLESLGVEGDVLFGISTSGNSLNVINAFKLASKKNISTVSFTGKDGGKLKNFSDLNINIESLNTARIQEMHILLGHILCELSDDIF